ncbi:MAG: class C sortase [Bacillota bacterium]|nr:class C sortase [Bacillota bacterium]
MTRKNKNINYKKLALFVIFVLGFLVALYPIISNLYYRQVHTSEVNDFISGKSQMSTEDKIKKIELARQYNNTLDPSRLSDPYTEKEKEGIAEYARMLEIEEKIGFVEIPQIQQKLPVYAGSSDSVLERAAGHLEGTSLPVGGQSSHAVITAHRGLPKAKLFRDLDKLKMGDIFYFHNLETVLAYQVDQILTVEPWDFEPVLVVEGEDLMTLLTCTPYMINSHRLLVRGHRIDYVPPVIEDQLATTETNNIYQSYLPYIIGLLILVSLVALYYLYSYRKTKKKVENFDKK